ncbi:MAG: hypothetical protein ACI39R_04920 [Lachnospiraceae bacterium]
MFFQHLKSRLFFMIQGTGFKIAISIIMVFCLCNTIFWAIYSSNSDALYEIQSTEALLIYEYSFFSQFFRLLVIFILLLPFSFSFYRDRRLGIKSVLQSKYGVRRYYVVNLITCFIGTFLAFFIPFMIEFGIDEILFTSDGITCSLGSRYSYNYGALVTGDNLGENDYGSGMLFRTLFIDYPQLYNLLYIVFFSFFMALLAVFVYSLSYWVKKYSLILLLPLFIIYTLQRKLEPVIIDITGVYVNPRMLDYVFVKQTSGIHWGYFGCLCLFFITVIIVSTEISMRRDQL